MITKPLGIPAVTGLLSRAIEEKGADYIYPRHLDDSDGFFCRYRDRNTGQPDCIIGHVFSYLGILDDEHVTEGAAPGGQPAVTQGLFTNEALGFLDWVQSGQDSGKSWGEAVTEATELYKEAS